MITFYMSVITRFFCEENITLITLNTITMRKLFEKLFVYWLGRVLSRFYIPFHIFHAILHGYESSSGRRILGLFFHAHHKVKIWSP